MDDHDDLLKIGEFAERAGTNLRTLRYYEELGLIRPAQRSGGGFRYYRPTDVNRVRLIHGLQELGLQLERIRALLDTRRDGADAEDSHEDWFQRISGALEEHDALLDARIETLQRQKALVAEAAAKLAACRTCEHTPGAANNYCEPCQRTGDPLPAILSALF